MEFRFSIRLGCRAVIVQKRSLKGHPRRLARLLSWPLESHTVMPTRSDNPFQACRHKWLRLFILRNTQRGSVVDGPRPFRFFRNASSSLASTA